MVEDFCNMLKNEPADLFSGFTFYQFRDDGRLGLETTDPNNKEVGIEQPIMKAYKNIIQDEFFYPGFETKNEAAFPVTLRWGSFEDSTGLSIPLHFDGNPVFAEVYFDEDLSGLNLMMELNGSWFYKAPGVKMIDLMPAFYEKPVDSACDISIKVFAPPATGENDASQGDGWTENYFTTIMKMPMFRIRLEPIMP
jgi:hypothetical protein